MAQGWLKEVEEDATYIQTRRFAEQQEEQQRLVQKQEQAKAKADAKLRKDDK